MLETERKFAIEIVSGLNIKLFEVFSLEIERKNYEKKPVNLRR